MPEQRSGQHTRPSPIKQKEPGSSQHPYSCRHRHRRRKEFVRAAQPGLERMAHVGAAKTISMRSSAPLTGGSGYTKRWGAVMTIPWSLATGLPALHQA